MEALSVDCRAAIRDGTGARFEPARRGCVIPADSLYGGGDRESHTRGADSRPVACNLWLPQVLGASVAGAPFSG